MNEILHGDVGDLIGTIRDKFDAIIVDPPYHIDKYFETFGTLDDYVLWMDTMLFECVSMLNPYGLIFVYGFSEILAHISAKWPAEKQRWLIWHYTNKNVPSCSFWQRSHESIMCMWNDDRPDLDVDAIREPYTPGSIKNHGKVRKATEGRFNTGKETVYTAHPLGALPRDVLKIPALAAASGKAERWFLCLDCDKVYPPGELANHREHRTLKHPTQKPRELTRRLLKGIKDCRSVFVPFAGSGSECSVAKELGMGYLGIEIDDDFIRIARASCA